MSQAQGASCGYEFRTGQSYLVLARHASTDRLSTGLCSGTRALEVEPVVAAFGPGYAPKRGDGQGVPQSVPEAGGQPARIAAVAGGSVAVVALLIGIAILARRHRS